MDARGLELRIRVVEVQQRAGRRQGCHYPVKVKQDVAVWAMRWRSRGHTLRELGSWLGLDRATLGAWVAGYEASLEAPERASGVGVDSVAPGADLVPVHVAPSRTVSGYCEAGGGLVLVTPGGYRVSGLDVEGAAALLARVP